MMARLQVPETSAFVRELCKQSGVRLRRFKAPKAFESVVSRFLKEHDIIYLATTKNDRPRCTPLGYTSRGTTVYILCEGGGKFANLKANAHVAYSVASRIGRQTGLTAVRGLQVWGKAEVISMKENPEKFSKGLRVMGIAQRLKKRGQTLPPFHYRIIKIEPEKMRLLDLSNGIHNVTWVRK
jgi:uncharacterized protein YhbP (UPF0306 family)